MNSLPLDELFELDKLQRLQEGLIRVTGVNLTLVDGDGNAVLRAAHTADGDAPRPAKARGKKAMTALRKLLQENRISKGPAVTTSPHSGLTTAAVPLFLGSQHLGAWIVGEVLMAEADADLLRKTMVESGVPAEEADRQFEQLPVLNQQQLDQIIALLAKLNDILLGFARSNVEMSRNNDEMLALVERLDSTAQMLGMLTNSADAGMCVSDFFTGEILQGNEQFARICGKSLDELIGRTCFAVADPKNTMFCAECPHDRLLDDKGRPGQPVVWERYDPSLDAWLRLTHQALYWVDGRLAHMVTYTDITQNKKLQQQLAHYAFYDRSLQLPNALKLNQDAQEWDKDTEIYVICFDIVSLRTINDVYSRETGDALLSAIASWVEKLDVIGAQLYRIDGDEFGFVLHGMDKAVVLELAEIVHARFHSPWLLSINGQSINVFCDISIGVVDVNGNYDEAENLITIIERTLDRSFQDGKVVVYGEKMDSEYREQLKLEHSLKNCVMEGLRGFEVHYQPIVDPISGTWCALEALCRWNSPDCGPVTPVVFIHKAEQMGLIGPIGTWVLDTAVRQCKAWGLDKNLHFSLDVNLSPAQITDDSLAATVLHTLKLYDFPPEKLLLEITESTELYFSNQTMNVIERLRGSGVQMALDDFGTGYSSFNNLKQLPVSVLKTERAFLSNIENDSYLQYLYHVMVELAHAAGMRVIAEGVETEEQMQLLLQNGVDFMQGYMFSKPLPPDKLQENLEMFYRSGSVYPAAAGVGSVDLLGMVQNPESLIMPPQLYQMLGECTQYLLAEPDPGVSIPQVLRHIGIYFRLSRVFIYMGISTGEMVKVYEWCADGVSPMPYTVNIEQDDPRNGYFEYMNASGMAQCCAEDADSLSALLGQYGTMSNAALPLRNAKGETFGAVGLDDCVRIRGWKQEEALILHNLCTLLARVLMHDALCPLPQELGEDQETINSTY